MAISERQKKKQKEAAAYFRALMSQKATPRNQVASLSGLSNTYIGHLEKGQIANASRDKLIAFGVALSLSLPEIDQLLTAFDRAKLSEEDIPLFLETGGKRRISKAMLPLRDWYTYELHIMLVERIPGQLIIVNDRPTANILPEGFRSYTDRQLIGSHPIYGNLIEAVGRARRRNLEDRLAESPLDHYICRRCLEVYASDCPDPIELQWRRKHIEQLIQHVQVFDRFRLHITEACSRFNFTLVIPGKESEDCEKLLFMGKTPHGCQRRGFDQLSGFATENEVVVSNFKEGLESVKSGVIPKLEDRDEAIRYLGDLVRSS